MSAVEVVGTSPYSAVTFGFGFAGDVFEDFLEILQVEQRQMFVVAEFVDERDEARLRFVEPEHAGKKERPELQHSRPETRARFVRESEKFHRISARRPVGLRSLRGAR